MTLKPLKSMGFGFVCGFGEIVMHGAVVICLMYCFELRYIYHEESSSADSRPTNLRIIRNIETPHQLVSKSRQPEGLNLR